MILYSEDYPPLNVPRRESEYADRTLRLKRLDNVVLREQCPRHNNNTVRPVNKSICKT